jgi:6-phosphogluconolactonase (cycloisomerase 2 family)
MSIGTLKNIIGILGILVLAAGCAQSGASQAQGGQGERTFLYVCNQNDASGSVIDMRTNEVVQTVDLQALGFSSEARPHHSAVERDGSFWYLSLIGDNKVLKFNRQNELVGQVDFERPGMLALDTMSDRLYVGRSMAAVNPPQRIGMIDRGEMSIDEYDVFFPRPHAIAVNPQNDIVYTASLAVNNMASIDVEQEEMELTTLDGMMHTFVQFALSPDGKSMVVGGEMTGKFMVFDITSPQEPTLVKMLDVNAAPWHPVFTPDGRFVYIGNKRANTITVVDASDWTIETVIEGQGISEPHGSAVSPDGKYVYISNNNLKGAYVADASLSETEQPGTVVVIDTATNKVENIIEVGHYAAGLSN